MKIFVCVYVIMYKYLYICIYVYVWKMYKENTIWKAYAAFNYDEPNKNPPELTLLLHRFQAS